MPAVRPVQLPRPEALVRDRAVAPDLALAHVHVGAHDAAVHRVQQPDGDLGDGVGVAPRRAQHRDAAGGGTGDVDVGRIAAAGADRPQRQLEHRSLDAVALDDEQLGALGDDALGQLLRVVEPQRSVVDPGIEDHVGAELPEPVEAGASERRGDEGQRLVHRAQSRTRLT